MTYMDDEHRPKTPDEAYNYFADKPGQVYIRAQDAFEALAPFFQHTTATFVAENGLEDDPDEVDDEDRAAALWAISVAVKDAAVHADDARGLTDLWPHEQLVSAADATDIAVRLLGREENRGSGIGAGFEADDRHEKNLSTIADALDLDTEE